MRFKTTLVLLVLAGAVGVCLWELRPSRPTELPTTLAFESITADTLDGVVLEKNGKRVVLTRGADRQWLLAGSWPTQKKAIEDLVKSVTDLESRFEPIALDEKVDLKPYGLDPSQNPLHVTLRAGEKSVELTLGRGEAELAGTPFAQPTYLRVGDKQEVYRLQPGLLARLKPEPDAYERRRLFPHWERLQVRVMPDRPPIPGQPPPEPIDRTLEILNAPALLVQGPGMARQLERIGETVGLSAQGLLPVLSAVLLPAESPDWYELKRTGPVPAPEGESRAVSWDQVAEAWTLQGPVPEKVASDPLSKVLVALPDIWAKRFTSQAELLESLPSFLEAGQGAFPGSLAQVCLGAWQATRFGLVVPERSLRLKLPGGGSRTLLIGGRVPEREAPGASREPARYARLEGNDAIFEIEARPIDDLFVSLATLRESRAVPFDPSRATQVVLKHGGGEVVVERENGQWKVKEPYRAEADSATITDLLTQLSSLTPISAPPSPMGTGEPGIFYVPYQEKGPGQYTPTPTVAKSFGLDSPLATLEITLEPKKDASGSSTGPRTLTVMLGRHDRAAKELYLWSMDRPRVNVVGDGIVSLVNRPALAYRSRRVLDFSASDLKSLQIDHGGQKVTLAREKETWKLAEPAAADIDAQKAEKLAGVLTGLQAEEYVASKATEEQLEKEYGLAKPTLSATLSFAANNRPARTLQMGKARMGKPGYYARLSDDPGIFVVSNEVYSSLTQDPLALLPTQLWKVPVDDIVAMKVSRKGEAPYELARKEGGWQIQGPFQAPALDAVANQMANDLSAPECAGYRTLEAKDPAALGLDMPYLTLTLSGRDGKQHELMLGNRVKPDGILRYARKKESPAVFEINEFLGGLTERSALDLLDPVLLRIVFPAELEEVESKRAGGTLTLKREGGAWVVAGTPAGPFSPDPLVVNDYQLLLSSLRAQQYAAYGEQVGKELGKYGLDKPEVTLKVKIRPSSDSPKLEEHTVEVGKQVEGGSDRYVRIDGKPGVAILSANVDRRLTRGPLDFVSRDVLKLDASKVTSLTRKAGEQTLRIGRQDDEWTILEPVREDADTKVMDSLVSRLARLRAERVAAYPAGDLKMFGLEEPPAVVTLAEGSDRTVLRLGKVADEKTGNRFAMVEGGKAVHVVAGDVAGELLAGPLAFRDRNLVRLRDADRMDLERDRRKATFSRVAGTWKLTAPVEASASQIDLDDFLNALARLRADALVAEKPTAEQLKSYGLEKPEARWHLFRGEDAVLDLVIGGSEKDSGRRYARLGDGPLVFLLDPSLSRQVLAEYRSRTVWSPSLDAAQVESIRLGYPENPFVLEKEGDGWRLAGMPGVMIDSATVNDTLATLAGLKLVRYVRDRDADPKLYGLDPSALTLEVTTPQGKRTLQLGATEGGSAHRYARIPDPLHTGVFVLSEEDCQKLMRDLNAFRKKATPPEKPAEKPEGTP